MLQTLSYWREFRLSHEMTSKRPVIWDSLLQFIAGFIDNQLVPGGQNHQFYQDDVSVAWFSTMNDLIHSSLPDNKVILINFSLLQYVYATPCNLAIIRKFIIQNSGRRYIFSKEIPQVMLLHKIYTQETGNLPDKIYIKDSL